ncbi:hypothetical protein LCGC14_2759770, partial [marine sediment metagenome]
MKGNRLGGTLCGAMELAMHLTGEYPDWWPGRKYDRAVLAWAGSVTTTTQREVVQKMLLGCEETDLKHPLVGTGAIPADSLIKITNRQAGVRNVIDQIKVHHVSGGESIVSFKTYEQGLSVLQGVFTFVSGQVAKTDPDAMTLNTPVATIGIRGTQLGVDFADGKNLTVVLMEEADGFVGEVVVTNNGGLRILNGAYEATQVSGIAIPPSAVFDVPKSKLLDTFGESLQLLPTEGNNANDFGLDDASVEELIEEAIEEELAEDALEEEEELAEEEEE